MRSAISVGVPRGDGRGRASARPPMSPSATLPASRRPRTRPRWSLVRRRSSGATTAPQAAVIQRRRQARGRGLPRHLDHVDPIQAEHPHAVAQATPPHQIPVVLGTNERSWLDPPRPGGLAMLVSVVQTEHASLHHGLFHGAKHRGSRRLGLACNRRIPAILQRRRCDRSPTSPPPPCAVPCGRRRRTAWGRCEPLPARSRPPRWA